MDIRSISHRPGPNTSYLQIVVARPLFSPFRERGRTITRTGRKGQIAHPKSAVRSATFSAGYAEKPWNHWFI